MKPTHKLVIKLRLTITSIVDLVSNKLLKKLICMMENTFYEIINVAITQLQWIAL